MSVSGKILAAKLMQSFPLDGLLQLGFGTPPTPPQYLFGMTTLTPYLAEVPNAVQGLQQGVHVASGALILQTYISSLFLRVIAIVV